MERNTLLKNSFIFLKGEWKMNVHVTNIYYNWVVLATFGRKRPFF